MIKKLLFSLAFLPSILLAQHSIKGVFTPAEDFKFAILYKVTPTTSIYVNNAEIDPEGNFEFQLDSTSTKGMYRIVYALPQDEFNFDIIYNKNEDIELNFDLEKGLTFIKSQENKTLDAYRKSMTLVSNSINQYYAENNSNKKDYKKIISVLTQTQDEFEKASKGMIAHEFIKANKPYIPSDMEDAKTFSKNVKEHYFNNIDFANQTLQSSNFLIETTLNYLFNFVDNTDPNNSYIKNIDNIVNAIGNNNTIKEVILEVIWNQFAEQGNETVANYTANHYLLDIAKAKKDTELVEKLTIFNNISINQIAPNFTLEVPNKEGKVDLISLKDYKKSNQYIIVFWSSTCSHCLKEMPLLKDFIASYNQSQVQVIAVGLENTPYRWKETIADFPNFMHIYGKGKWDNPIGDAYGVTATPTYFILDKDKKIIAKPEDLVALEAYYKQNEIGYNKEKIIQTSED